MIHIPADSFSFNGMNSLETWGIKVVAYDVFSPNKRERNQMIPLVRTMCSNRRRVYLLSLVL